MSRSVFASALILAALGLTQCSGPVPTAPSPEAENTKTAPVEPVTAKTAFWEMYKPAHAWAADLLPLKIEAMSLAGYKNEGGKAAMWEATFASPSRKEFTKFSYAIAAVPPDIRKGVTASTAIPWGGPSKEAMPFVTGDLNVDSDAAYQTAAASADAWLKKHPGKELTIFSIGAASRFHGPVWSFQWGDKKDGFFALVSATTGKLLK